jgi:hypothetical protein
MSKYFKNKKDLTTIIKAPNGEYACFGGNREFYQCIGFEVVCHREKWNRVW